MAIRVKSDEWSEQNRVERRLVRRGVEWGAEKENYKVEKSERRIEQSKSEQISSGMDG